ncbi:MAG: sulfatase-like hydrolase/transferase [Planctomycetota bacterium]
MQKRNVLYVMTDQHKADCTGYEGHPDAKTPHLDRLAATGTAFRHSYTANPICTPTRVSILSGQYCHNHGYFGLGGPTPGYGPGHPAKLPTFLGHFRSHGYRTAALGKLHLPDEPVDWGREDCDLYMPLQWRQSDGQSYLTYLKQHGYADDHDAEYLAEHRDQGNCAIDARPSNLPFEHSVEGYTNRHAIDFIDRAARDGKPFCMEVSYFRPHQVYTPDQRFWDLYDDDIDLPPGALDDLNPDRPPHFRKTVESTRQTRGLLQPDDPESRMRRVWRGYLASISHCDHAVGELLDHLDKTGLADNTIVVYHSDHGAYSGTFGINEKAPGICSEAVCRVPMLWRVPGMTQPGHVSPALTHTVDLAPTFACLCGLPAMQTVDGEDLTPLLRGDDDATVRDVAVTEHPWSKSLRWKQWRFVHYQPEMFDADVGELYDIDSDPLETTNLYHDPASQDVVNECRRRLLEWLIATTRIVTSLPVVPPESGPFTHATAPDGRLRRDNNPHAAHASGGTLNYL